MRAPLALALVGALGLFAACRSGPDAPPPAALTRVALDGVKPHLGASEARLRVVNFWATWCVPCRREFPDLVRVQQAFGPKDVELVFASLDFPEVEDSVRAYLARQNAGGRSLLVGMPTDPAAFLAFEPGWAGELPSTFVYDAAGTLRYARIGRIQEPAFSDTLRALLASTR